MRKKFTMLLTALLAFVGVAKADVTDLPTLTEDTSNPTWYTIKNTRSGKFVTYNGDDKKMSQQSAAVAASFFYFTAGEGEAADGFTAIKIHNFATTNLMADFEKWDATGATWYLHVDATNGNTPKGFHFTNATNLTGWNAWNDHGQSEIGSYYSNDAGGVFEISAVTDFSAVIDIDAAKATAIAEINNYAVESTIYPAATDAVAAVNAVNPASNGLKDLNDAVEAINAIVVNYRNAAYQALDGKYFTIQTLATDRSQGFMKMDATKVVGTADASSPANIWQFVCNDNGTVNIYNPYTGKYLCEPQGNSVDVAVTTDKANAGAYVLNVNANPSVADAKVKFTSNTKSVHMAGGHTLVRWDNGAASEWQVVEVTNFSALINSYKTSAIATLDGWKPLSVVFDAALIETAKTAINDINTTDYATFAAIDAELTKVMDDVEAKTFTFQTTATDNHRENVWMSANMNTSKAIGLHGESNYNSIWSLRHAGGVSFYLYNELNSVYMGKPSENCPLTVDPAVAFTFEIVDAANKIVEMHTNGETVHASNHGDDKLLNHDGDEAASRWYITKIDIAADITEILNGLTAADYAEVPGLGQYPKAAYDALVAAKTTAKTVEEVEHAIAAFKAAKNLPVFTIDGVISYAAGKSIYDDPVNQNDKGNTHYFKTTDIYDKTMWWALDLTEETVSVVESVGIYNVGTGAGFWGSSTIKIADTSDGGAAEGIFLFYTTGNNNPIHAQNSGSVITRYGDTGKATGSAWKFTYIGNTYDLNKLTDAHLEAAEDLKVVYEKYASYEDDEFVYNATPALGEYAVSADDFKSALAAVKQYANASVSELAKSEVSAMTTAAETLEAKAKELFASKNMPVFTISNGDVKDYAVGKSIYDDNSGTLHFKTTNLYDKTMWWALDQVETTVSVTGENYVGIYNVGTGNGFLGAASIKVTETNENEGAGIADDDLFLIYKNGGSHPAHFQESGSSIVEYWSYEATSGSAAKFTYIGNTYDLNKLSPEFVEKIEELKVAFDAKAALHNAMYDGLKVSLGTGVGQYKGDDESFAEIMNAASFLLSKDLIFQLQNTTVADLETYIATINGFALNMPEEGKYYRIKGANDGKQNYLTGNVTANGDRIALQADATDATIFQYVGGKLLAVESNLYVDLKNWTFQILASKAENTEFAASTRNFNAYTIKCGSFFHYNGDYLNRCGSDGADETAHDWLLEEVDAASVPANNNLLTDLANLYNASFRIYGERGFIYVAEDSNVKGTNSVAVAYSKNDKSHFAVVTIGENNYLYNVGAQKFVTKEGNIVALTDYPEHAFTIVAADNQSTDFDWTIKVNNKKMNLSNSGANGVYTEWETEDEGNRWALYKAGVFDKTEAEKVRKVTVNYTLGEKTITKNFGKKVGETFEIPSFDFATITSCKKGEEDVTANEGTYAVEIDGAMTINVAIEEHLPFVTVADAANINTWYYAQMHAHGSYGFYVSASDDNKMVWYGDMNADSAKYVAGDVVPDSCLWGFAGNVVEGFKMISKADSKAVISTGSGEVAVGDLANATAFALTKSQAGGDWFCLKYPTNNNYLNLDVNKTIVNHWNANDNGSSFFLTEYNKEYSVTVNAEAGYSTYYSNYRLAIPETVKAYIIDNVNGKSINLTQVEGVLPANTGIILEGAGTHTFVTSAAETADVSDNLLKGTAVRTLITAEENTNYYVLAMPEGAEEAGLYKAALNKDANGNPVLEGGVAFHNGANKAYLPVVVEAAAEAPAMYSFTRGETTDIEGSELDAQGAMFIYDLTGRRVEKMEKGIYIVNGKKVLVK